MMKEILFTVFLLFRCVCTGQVDEKFAYNSSYAPFTAREEFQKNFSNFTPDADKINQQVKLFTISVCTEDFLYEPVKKNIAKFEEKKINVKATSYLREDMDELQIVFSHNTAGDFSINDSKHFLIILKQVI